MAVRFRPMPGLTVAVAICLPILIGLGIWQFQRWQWKTGVLAEVEAAVSAPPLQGLAALSTTDGPLDFRRIEFTGQAVGETRHLYHPEGNIAWMPMRVVEESGGQGSARAIVGFPTVADSIKDTASAPVMDGVRAGYVRRIQPRRGFARWLGTPDNPERNRYYQVNAGGDWLPGADLYIDASNNRSSADDLPVVMPDIPNNHVSYMLTWWSFALILLGIYAILHRRAGRLSFGPDSA